MLIGKKDLQIEMCIRDRYGIHGSAGVVSVQAPVGGAGGRNRRASEPLVPGAPILWMLRKQYGIFRPGTGYDLPGLREYSVPENFSGDYGGSDFRRTVAGNQVRRPRV